MRASLCTNPKVLLIANIISESTDVGRRLSTGFNGALCEIVTCDVTRDITIASLLRVWCATNEHTEDGVWRNSTLRTIDQAAGIPGFGEAMALAGWAIYDEAASTVTMPNFLENNAPAKNNARSSGAERQARYRQKLKEKAAPRDVTRDATVTSQSDIREEKRREDSVSSLRSETHGARDKADEEPSATKPTPAAAVCFAIRSAGIAQVNPAHPELLGLLEQGAEISHFVEAAKIAKDKGKPFAYVLGIVKSQLADGRALVDVIQTRSTRRQAAEPKETFRERDERLAREKMAAFLPGIAAKAPKDQHPANVIDVTPTNTSEIAHVVPHQLGR